MSTALQLLGAELANGRARQRRVLGIDLGTTNSTAADITVEKLEGSLPNPRCLPVAQPGVHSTQTHVLVPSVVALDSDVEYVGEGAKRLIAHAGHRLRKDRDIFWECKNDIGLRRTYHLAPEGYRSAAEIGTKVLVFLKEAADAAGESSVSRTVVTVPASFQTAQRVDTLRAAEMAGLNLRNGDLLDEPVAAFLDFALSHPERLADRLVCNSKLVVFDFGGGTCDVAIFELTPSDTGLDISTLAVSRYHRLGGGDIDRAIVHQVLIPQICDENSLGKNDLDYEEKRVFLEPSLLAVAEALKVQICEMIRELNEFGKATPEAIERLVAEAHPLPPLQVRNRTFTLNAPQLSGRQFASVLRPFLDVETLCAFETEYYLTNSIFTPLKDALNRAGLDSSVVSMVLMVGGSSLIPHVQDAVKRYFKSATILAHDSPDRLQTAVARGAAFHAYILELYGKPLFRPVAHDSICVRSTSGLHELVRKGEVLSPQTDDCWSTFDGLVIARTELTKETLLRLELVAGEEERLLYRDLWRIPPPVNKGDHLRLEYRFNQNQIFEFRMGLADWTPDEATRHRFQHEIENPLTHVVNPQSIRLQIDEIEEEIRTRAVPNAQIPEKVVEAAELYAELGQTEKAISYLNKALQTRGRADSAILHRLGLHYGEIGDYERQADHYRKAAQADRRASGSLFNLALAQWGRREFNAALETLDDLEERLVDGPGLTLRALVLDALGRSDSRDVLGRAVGKFAPLPQQSEWELFWFQKAAELKGDVALKSDILAERSSRKKQTGAAEVAGELPAMKPSIVPS